ncbi:MAG: hypothetical protein HYX97_03345, partial [Chloroflexi bacterium]|nr:hypothetical protein [Chloroflexota bacterium]
FRVDSYKFCPAARESYQRFPEQPGVVPPAPVRVPPARANVAFLTTAGLYLKHSQPCFNWERERREPKWGDPTYRVIPRGVAQEEVDVAHLHIRADDILDDFNIVLPLDVLGELERLGEVGAVAERHYSFMGYQPFPFEAWRDVYAPEVVRLLHADAVDLLILAPT